MNCKPINLFTINININIVEIYILCFYSICNMQYEICNKILYYLRFHIKIIKYK